MSRTEADTNQRPAIPNMQAMVVPQFQPPKPPAEGFREVGGTSVGNAPELKAADLLKPSNVVGTVVTGYNAGLGSVRRYRVAKAGSYKAPGSPQKILLYEGKILDTSNYDIRSVRSQGIKLIEVDANDEDIVEKPTDDKQTDKKRAKE